MRNLIEGILNEIDVKLDGPRPWDVKVHDESFISKIITKQSVGSGESYMDGQWDCDRLDELFFRVCRYSADQKFTSQWKHALVALNNTIFNQQTREKSEEVAKVHYNLGNDLFEKMLGKSMAYTCGYWKDANNLDEAQFAKYDLTCRKMRLKKGDTVLEIGCGWGGLAKFMAENYGAEVVAIDIGKEPANYAKNFCLGLPVKVFQCDYRDTQLYNPNQIQFDKIVSVGVLEHVGNKNYKTLLNIARAFLKEDGIFLLHSIGGNVSKNYCDRWINKYIFPNGMLPSLKQLGKAFEERFIVEDYQNFGAYYDKTLMAWHANFNEHWSSLRDKYDERFRRMMNYYLLSCAGGFRARAMQLWQFVLTPRGMMNGYVGIR